MTRPYEMLYILNPEIGEEAIEAKHEKIKGLLELQGGEVEKLDLWGHNRLAYEINDLREGFFALVHFKTVPEQIEEIERQLRIDDTVLRFLVTRV